MKQVVVHDELGYKRVARDYKEETPTDNEAEADEGW